MAAAAAHAYSAEGWDWSRGSRRLRRCWLARGRTRASWPCMACSWPSGPTIVINTLNDNIKKCNEENCNKNGYYFIKAYGKEVNLNNPIIIAR